MEKLGRLTDGKTSFGGWLVNWLIQIKFNYVNWKTSFNYFACKVLLWYPDTSTKLEYIEKGW